MARKALKYGFVKANELSFRGMIFGDYASGKTTIAASANLTDALGPVIIGDIDEGMSAVSHWTDLRRVPLHSPGDLEQFLLDMSTPKEHQDEFLKPVKTIIIDSVSALKDETLLAMTTVQANKGKREDAFDTQWKDYGRTTNFLLAKFDVLRAQGYNIILIAGSAVIQQDGLELGIRPDLNAALLKCLNYRMSNIWYAEQSQAQNRYRLLLEDKPKLGIKTKTRNTLFREALIKLTEDEAVKRGEDPVKQRGWYYIPDQDHPTLPNLYQVYLESGAAQEGNENG